MATAPPLGKELASADKKIRDKAVLNLRQFLVSNADTDIEDLEMAKLWKGIFYCFWMSDKPLVQQELSSALANLLLDIPSASFSLRFLRGFWESIVREWSGLDYIRIDKYYMLVRRFVNASFRLLIREHWSTAACKEYNDILTSSTGPLNHENSKVPSSLTYHLADIYNEELDKAMKAASKSSPAPLATLIEPFFRYNARSASPVTHKRLNDELFTPILTALLEQSRNTSSSTAAHYRSTIPTPALSPNDYQDSDEPRRKRARIEKPRPKYANLIANACLTTSTASLSNADKADEDSAAADGTDEDTTAQQPLSPRDLRTGLLKLLFDIASEQDTKEASRSRMRRVWKEACEAEEDGITLPSAP